MNCFEFRQLRLSDPYSQDASADEHQSDCGGCTAFEKEITLLDGNIRSALSVEVPDGLAATILLNQSLQNKSELDKSRRFTPRVWLSMAASVLLVGVLGIQYLARPAALPDQILAHVQHKPHEFYGEEHRPISEARLRSVLRTMNAESDLENVVYAAVCPLNGEQAAHLVVKNGDDQYTVMLIPDYSPTQQFQVDNDIWRGYISPHPAGALAVLANVDHPDAVARIKEMRDRYQVSVHLTAGL